MSYKKTHLTKRHKKRISDGVKKHLPSSIFKSEEVMGQNNPFYGKHHSEETRIKISKIQGGTGKLETNCIVCDKKFRTKNPARIKNGRGKFCSKRCMYVGRKKLVGEKHPRWKGNDVKYYGLHSWVRKHLGQPNTCEFCGKSGLDGHKIHWANINHNYKRIKEDWLRLCVRCHSYYDRSLLKIN